MAIVQISQIQVRRGLQQDLPNLAAGEFGWSQDTRKLFIGNGTTAEGAPEEGQTEILTQFSILNFTNTFTSNVVNLNANVTAIQSNIITINNEISALHTGILSANVAQIGATSSGIITVLTANNAVINYTLTQGTKNRTGTIRSSYNSATSTVAYDEEYSETGTTDIVFSMDANSTQANLKYITTTATTVLYRTQSF